jgi:hypothetical protein
MIRFLVFYLAVLAIASGSVAVLRLKGRVEKLEQRTDWICRLKPASSDNIGQLVIIDGDHIKGCP